MMAAIFATLFAAFAFGWFGRRNCALICVAVCFCLAIYLFQWEIYSPETGFRMPWLKVSLPVVERAS
jgi:hypothetical protein